MALELLLQRRNPLHACIPKGRWTTGSRRDESAALRPFGTSWQLAASLRAIYLGSCSSCNDCPTSLPRACGPTASERPKKNDGSWRRGEAPKPVGERTTGPSGGGESLEPIGNWLQQPRRDFSLQLPLRPSTAILIPSACLVISDRYSTCLCQLISYVEALFQL